jgi:hypothetical protein
MLVAPLTLEHFVRQTGKSRVWGTLKQETAFRSMGSSTPKEASFEILLVLSTQSELRVSSTIATHDQFYAIEFAALYQLQRESGGPVAF